MQPESRGLGVTHTAQGGPGGALWNDVAHVPGVAHAVQGGRVALYRKVLRTCQGLRTRCEGAGWCLAARAGGRPQCGGSPGGLHLDLVLLRDAAALPG